MNRSFFTTAILLTGLYVATSLASAFLYVWLGTRLTEAGEIFSWLVCVAGIATLWMVVLLIYYYHKEFRFAFWAGLVNLLVVLIHTAMVYRTFRTHEITAFYIASTVALLVAGMVHGLGLVFSSARSRIWLRVVGWLGFAHGCFMLFLLTWSISSVEARLDGTIERLDQLAAFFGSLLPVCFLINFYNEKQKAQGSAASSMHGYLGFLTAIAFVVFLVFGARMATSGADVVGGNTNNTSAWFENLARPFDSHVFRSTNGDSLQYRLLKPLDYDSTLRYPVVVCLHGSSARGTDNAKQVAGSISVELFSTAQNRERYRAFLFVPQCPPDRSWGGLGDFPAVDSLVFEALFQLEKEYPIDPARRYLAGTSLGGYGAWHLACARPEVFAAVMPVCGGGDPAKADRLVDVPVWAFHGAKDLNVPVSGSRDMINAIRKAGGDPRYTEFAEATHNIRLNVMETEGLADWLFAQRKQ